MNMVNGIDMDNPFNKCILEEKKQMSEGELTALYEGTSKYLKKKYELLKGNKLPKFNSIEEIRAYYHCRPFDEAIGEIHKLFD